MTDYAITFARSARKELASLPSGHVTRILDTIRSLRAEPRPRGCRKIRGAEGIWRVRVGDYRIVFGVDDGARTIDVVAVRHRRDVYR